MTPSPRVTCPSPAMTTLPLRRTQRTVVDRIKRFVLMRVILDYSSLARPFFRAAVPVMKVTYGCAHHRYALPETTSKETHMRAAWLSLILVFCATCAWSQQQPPADTPPPPAAHH